MCRNTTKTFAACKHAVRTTTECLEEKRRLKKSRGCGAVLFGSPSKRCRTTMETSFSPGRCPNCASNPSPRQPGGNDSKEQDRRAREAATRAARSYGWEPRGRQRDSFMEPALNAAGAGGYWAANSEAYRSYNAAGPNSPPPAAKSHGARYASQPVHPQPPRQHPQPPPQGQYRPLVPAHTASTRGGLRVLNAAPPVIQAPKPCRPAPRGFLSPAQVPPRSTTVSPMSASDFDAPRRAVSPMRDESARWAPMNLAERLDQQTRY